MVGGVEPKDVSPENLEFKRLYVAYGRSQPETARAIGVTSGAVSRYLAGLIRPKRPVLRILADLAGEPLNLPGEEEPSRTRNQGARWLTDWESEIIGVLRALAPERRRMAITAIRDLVRALGAEKIPRTADLARARAGDLIRKAEARTRGEAVARSSADRRPKPAGERVPVPAPFERHHTEEKVGSKD